ncbi:cytochrome P450 [Williamsia sp. CHRR-6]|uniref:cytochrome P450 n=1 Tax=Williamsia sp. CHRR-6 TaxID=2835871 RepID=UPI001BDACB3C|nr:cytochrome P450 [Williamsia sp. CHRR-6]MBT0568274.1 cytochrome P450 [Williamsia sp. CHRR-6]
MSPSTTTRAPDSERGSLGGVPPRIRIPAAVVAAMIVLDRRRAMRSMRRRHGSVFAADLPVFGSSVIVADRELVREMFTTPPHLLGQIDQNLGRVLGPNSMFALDGDPHRDRRKLLAPPFHGRRLASYAALMETEALREFDTWPSAKEFAVQPSMMRLTLSIILRAVFGADGQEFERLRVIVPALVELGSRLQVVPVPRLAVLGDHSPWGALARRRREYDAVVGRLIAAAQDDPQLSDRNDVLAMMVQSRYDDGSAMTPAEISDELLTVLSAGHETTATTLAWAVERLRRHPEVLFRLNAELDAGDETLLDATILEVQRSRSVIDLTVRQVMVDEFTLGPWTVRKGQTLIAAMGLVHDDPDVFDQPHRFDPDRFVGGRADTTSPMPFGGGTRRCIGAAFATMELKVVLRTLLREFDVQPTTQRGERWHSRGVALAPGRGGRVVVSRRTPAM